MEDGSKIENVPYSLSLPRKGEFNRHSGGRSYVVEAKLKKSEKGGYFLAVNKDTPWHPVKGSWGLAEMRFWAKRYATDYIYGHISSGRAAKFLAGLAVGEFDDRMMVYEFSRFGLQHLMAISGFHFGIIAYIFGLFLCLFLPFHRAQKTLMVLLSVYCLFLGWAPSVMRAWITIMIGLMGQAICKQGNGLNSLGIALLVILIIDPLAYQNIGFQFSFATTAAILLFFQPMHDLVQYIFPKRHLSEMLEFDKLSQHAYILLSGFRTSLALSMAVTIIAVPMTLVLFHKFPVLSLFYNLFFPFLVSFSMLFLILGILWSWIPPISYFIHEINTIYTECVLNVAYELPTRYDVVWIWHGLDGAYVVVWMTILYLIGFIMNGFRKEEPMFIF